MSGPSSPVSTAEQRRLAERYLLERPVGRGGAGVVWQATDELLGRTVAIKECMLPPTVDDADRDRLLSRVMREARTAARLDHPALVTVFDVVQESGRPWIVMEYVESRSLAQVVREDGPLSLGQVVDIGLTLLDALHVAHLAGVMHRDVKPANVLQTPTGTVVLTDFGIAASTGDPTLTTSGMLLGSPSYMSPERARGEAATAASDIWSLGATLYTLIEGVTPYTGEHPLAVLSAVADGRRRPMQAAGPLEPLLAEILDTEPGKRPSGVQARRALERIRGDLEHPSGPSTSGGTPIRTLGSLAGLSAAEQTSRFAARRRRKREEKDSAAADRSTQPGTTRGLRSGSAAGAGAAAVGLGAAAAASAAPAEQSAPAEPAAAAEVAAPASPASTETQASTTPSAPPATEPPAAEPTAAEPTAAEPPATDTPPPAAAAPAPTAGATSAGTATEDGTAPAGDTSTPARPEPYRPKQRPTPPPSSRPSPDRPAAGRSRRTAALLGGAALALVVLLVVGLLLTRAGGNDPSTPAAPAALPPASASAPTPASSTPASASPSPSASAGSAIPAGWQVQNGGSGWSIALPPGFTRSSSRTNQTDFRNADGVLLRVEIAPKANASAIGDWRSYEPSFRRKVSDYERIRIAPADGGDGTQAADWEFTFRSGGGQLHVLNQGKIDGRSAHALYWQTPDSAWDSSQQLREQIFATFQPPPQ